MVNLHVLLRVTVFPRLFLLLGLKEQQIHIGRIDLVWANWRIDFGSKRPDT